MYFIIVNSQVIANTSFLLDLWRLCANKDCSYSKDDIQSVGRIYLFQFALTGTPQPLTTITGHKTFMKLGSSLAVGNPYNDSFVNKDNDMLAVSATTLSKFPLLACLVVPVSDQRVKYQWVEWVHDSWVKSKIVENYFTQKKMILCMKKNISMDHVTSCDFKIYIQHCTISLFFEVMWGKGKHVALGARIRVIAYNEVYESLITMSWNISLEHWWGSSTHY